GQGLGLSTVASHGRRWESRRGFTGLRVPDGGDRAGAALARMEGEVGLRTLFERYPGLRIGQEAVRRNTRILRGCEQLLVTLSP
ncbi:MAG TPA: hypothetical protein VHM65_09400, partial [Candidatus Lustribacter sp.]|nr:hypothetical protein [Candidatus Lustribacter sp.]